MALPDRRARQCTSGLPLDLRRSHATCRVCGATDPKVSLSICFEDRDIDDLVCEVSDQRTPSGSQTANLTGEVQHHNDASEARLCVVFPRECAATHIIRHPLVLGRDNRVEIQINHATVSRQHLRLENDGHAGVYMVSDVGSRNGSWINSIPLQSVPRVLRNGDVLRAGGVVMVFETDVDDSVLTAPDASVTDAVHGVSMAAHALRHAIVRAADQQASVLITGESGTGKESVAHELHRLSQRRGPLVIANCAALNESLVESQLFGHVRGAFTGAVSHHNGLFRSADGGSLMLDEIGELPLSLQPKLLRAVESGELVPLGATQLHRVDTRVLAATNRDLPTEVREGRFRRDLFARLSIVRIVIPPLRNRRADILDWFDVLHQRWLKRRPDDVDEEALVDFSSEAIELLLLNAWPENLRGLDHIVHTIGVTMGGDRVTVDRLSQWLTAPLDQPELADRVASTVDEPSMDPAPKPPKPDRTAFLAALEEQDWNIRAVARMFGRSRRQIYRWLESFGIELPR